MTDSAPEQEYPRLEPEGDDAQEPGAYVWPAGKADLTKRFVAIIIDAVIAVVIGFIPMVGGIVAAAYWVLRDGLELEFMDQRSIGKKLTKLRPVRIDGTRLDMMDSVRRNWMFGLGGLTQFLLFIPILGWLLVIPVALVAFAFGVTELVMVLTQEDGRRFGDRWATTKVIEVDR
jgi:uncharacterized RDD family membrane protein YckC